MDNKIARIQSACKPLYLAVRILFVALIAFSAAILIYTVLQFSYGSEHFSAVVKSGMVHMRNESMPFFLGVAVPTMQLPTTDEAIMVKALLITSNLVVIATLLVPTIICLFLLGDTFFNLAYGKKTFTKESVHNLKLCGIITLFVAIFQNPLLSVCISIFATQKLYVLLRPSITGILLAFSFMAIAFFIDYLSAMPEAIPTVVADTPAPEQE